MAEKVCPKGHSYDASLTFCPICGKETKKIEDEKGNYKRTQILQESEEKEEPTHLEFIKILYKNADSLEEANKRINLLMNLVIALMMEVEVLQSIHIDDAIKKGEIGTASDYGKKYKEVALLIHNPSGVSTGIEKLLREWFGFSDIKYDRFEEKNLKGYIDTVFKRLRFSQEEVNEFHNKVREMRTWT